MERYVVPRVADVLPPERDEKMRAIELVEVSPRDGLQNESQCFNTSQKLALIGHALDAGARRIEATSFVHPGRVPQMADAEAVAALLPRDRGAIYIGLVLNKRGALRALNAGMDEIGAVCAASDSFGIRNQGQTAEQSLAMSCEVVRMGARADRRAQITIAVAFGCPFEGEIPHDRVVTMARTAAASGAIEVAIADTIGVASPGEVATLVASVKAAIAPLPVRVHFHNTRNTGLANVWAAIEAGAEIVDASLGGIGGCPFAPAATGNVPTEDVVYMLERSGVATGYDLGRILEGTSWLRDQMGRELPGMVSRSGPFPAASSQSAA